MIIPFENKSDNIYKFAFFSHTYIPDDLLFVFDKIKIKIIRNNINSNESFLVSILIKD